MVYGRSPDFSANDGFTVARQCRNFTGLPYNFLYPDKSGWEHRKHLKELNKVIASRYNIKMPDCKIIKTIIIANIKQLLLAFDAEKLQFPSVNGG